MKIQFDEHDGCFGINLTAENMVEAAALVRFGMNSTAEIRSCSSSVRQDGSFEADIVFGKHRRHGSEVPKRK